MFNPNLWASKPLNWINKSKPNGITIVGNGTFDGQGAILCNLSQSNYKVYFNLIKLNQHLSHCHIFRFFASLKKDNR